MNINARFKNVYFWLGLLGVIFSAAGIDFNTVTNWNLLIDGFKQIVLNPVSLISVLFAIVGVFTDTSTKGLKDGNK